MTEKKRSTPNPPARASVSEPAAIASKWNARYAFSGASLPPPAAVLSAAERWLPTGGQALDLACGRGANAVWLAERGLSVSAWDIAEQAIERLREHPRASNVRAEVRDVVAQPPAEAQFDVIVVSRFLERALCPAIAAALRPNGVLCYQTFTSGLSNPDYLLKPNELLTLFDGLHIRWYSEPSAATGLPVAAVRPDHSTGSQVQPLPSKGVHQHAREAMLVAVRAAVPDDTGRSTDDSD